MRCVALRGFIVGWLALAGVASGCAPKQPPPPAAPVPALAPAPISISPLPPEALARVREGAPAAAGAIERLHALAERAAAEGDAPRARELAELSLITLASVGAALEQPVGPAPASEEEPEPTAEPAAEAEPGDDDKPARRRGTRKRRAPVDAEALPMPGPPTPEDETAPIRQRLASLAEDLKKARETARPGDRVALEGVQTTLIEADRALAEGLLERAQGLADEADRLLAGITGEKAVAPAKESGGFFEDAHARLGERAIIRGGVVAVRIDDAVHYRDGSWQGDATSFLEHVRPLVRGYRTATVTLVTVGEPTQKAFVSSRDALARYLAQRFQVDAERIKPRDSTDVRLAPGTYLLLQEGNAGS